MREQKSKPLTGRNWPITGFFFFLFPYYAIFTHELETLYLNHLIPMEDYIYILLGIAWLVYTVYKAKQKSRNAKPADAQLNEPPEYGQESDVKSIFNEILETDIHEENTRSFADILNEYEEKRSQEHPVEKIQIDSKLDTVPEEEGLSVFDQDELEETVDSVPQDPVTLRGFLDFDIRKAIIYSEIINRPYK